MKFIRIGRTRWVNPEHVVSVTAHAGRSIVKTTDGEAITDQRDPEVLISELEADPLDEFDYRRLFGDDEGTYGPLQPSPSE